MEDDYRGYGTLLAYDGELLPAADAMARYKRDDELRNKYEEAENELDSGQLTWDDVENLL